MFLLLFAGCASQPFSVDSITARTNTVDVYHGVAVEDTYRWLEDENAPETQVWVESQNRITFNYLRQIPQRESIKKRLTQLWNFERFGTPFRQSERYFYSRNDGLQNQNVLYSQSSLDSQPMVVLDPNTFSADGTVALTSYAVGESGNLVAYGISQAGSDWQEWKVRDVKSGQDLEDHLQWIKFSSASWRKDDTGFFYSRYDAPNEDAKLTKVNYFHKLYFHRLGTRQEQDQLIYHRPDHKDWGFNGSVTDDGRYLIITASAGTDPRKRVLYLDLQEPQAEVQELLMDFDAVYDFIDNDGPVFWFLTDLDAPRGRVIGIDVSRPERNQWREIIPEADETLKSVNVIHDSFVCNYLKDACSQVNLFSLEGQFIREIDLPGLGFASGFYGKRTDQETFYTFTSFTVPGTVYRFDFAQSKSTVFRQPNVSFNPSEYDTKQVFYSSQDGTRVPMFITHRKGIPLNGKTPALLYGYGGFNIPLTPRFSVANLTWLEMGGVYAMANLRGGGEYGEKWHQAGAKLNKQNVFDDFIAAAQWLIENQYTCPKKLAIAGGSNGGLLVGAVLNQRPELLGAALPAVGVMDMLRFHQFTIGWAWTSDYGSSEDPDEFKALYAYSPLHNIKPNTEYPAVMITTADHDDRVVPAHSYKYAATLQAAQKGEAPILIRIETKAGHGAGKPTSKRIAEAADKWTFLANELRMQLPASFTSAESAKP